MIVRRCGRRLRRVIRPPSGSDPARPTSLLRRTRTSPPTASGSLSMTPHDVHALLTWCPPADVQRVAARLGMAGTPSRVAVHREAMARLSTDPQAVYFAAQAVSD